MDFRAYLADSDSDDDGDEEDAKAAAKAKKKAKRQKVRAKYKGLLQGLAEDSGDKSKGDRAMQDMEITFTPGLGDEVAKAVERATKVEGGEEEEETPYQQYLRKKKEKQAEKRRKKRLEKKEAGESESEEEDPEELRRRQAELELLVANPKRAGRQSRDKPEKAKGRKGKKQRKREEMEAEMAEAKEVSKKVTSDDRFSAMFTNQKEYELDPTNPHYKQNLTDKEIMRERRERREAKKATGKRQRAEGNAGDKQSVKSLMESVKRKTADRQIAEPKRKKRRVE